MTFRAANTGEILPRTDVIRVFSEEVERYKKSPEGAGFWGARMIWTTIRSFDNETIRASMKECVEAKKLYPHAIAGRSPQPYFSHILNFANTLKALTWSAKKTSAARTRSLSPRSSGSVSIAARKWLISHFSSMPAKRSATATPPTKTSLMLFSSGPNALATGFRFTSTHTC